MTQASAGAMHWSKLSENRFCERSAKAIGLSGALVERQLAWASRGRRWHTRWISWGSLGLPSETVPNLCLLVGRRRVVLAKRQPTLVIRVYWGVLDPGEGNHETAARRRVGSVRRRHRASARLVRITAPGVAGCLRCDERRRLLASRQRHPVGGRNKPRRVL